MLGKKKQVARNALGAALVFIFAAVPSAFAADEKGWYLGVSAGQTKADVDEAAFNSIYVAGGFTSASTSSDEKDTGWKVFGGYQLSKNWAVEGAYVDLGKATTKTTATGPAGEYTGEGKTKGWSFSGVGTLPVSDSFAVFGKLGAFLWDVDSKCNKVSGAGSCAASTNNASGTDLTYGIGVKYDFTKNVGLRVEWERFKNTGDKFNTTGTTGTGEADVDLLSLGIQFKFF